MGIEAFAEAAAVRASGLAHRGHRRSEFPGAVQVLPGRAADCNDPGLFYPQGDRLVADCRLVGRRRLPNQSEPQETTHFTARVATDETDARRQLSGLPLRLSSEGIVDAAGIYRIYFHGPAYQVLDRAWWDGKRMIGQMSEDLPSNHKPSIRPTLIGAAADRALLPDRWSSGK